MLLIFCLIIHFRGVSILFILSSNFPHVCFCFQVNVRHCLSSYLSDTMYVFLTVRLQIPDSVPSISTLPQLTDFHETLYEHYIIEGHFTILICNCVQSVITLDEGAKFEEGTAQVQCTSKC
jgi:hypothetical protein